MTTETKADPIGATPSAGFDPMAAWTQVQQSFHEMMKGAHDRAKTFTEEYATLEAQMFTRARTAIESWAQLANDAVGYSAELSAQARKLGLETARKVSAGA